MTIRQRLHCNTNWTDYTVSAQMQFSPRTPGRRHRWRLDPATGARYARGYTRTDPWRPNVLKLFKFTDWGTYTLMQAASLSAVGRDYTPDDDSSGTNITCRLMGRWRSAQTMCHHLRAAESPWIWRRWNSLHFGSR